MSKFKLCFLRTESGEYREVAYSELLGPTGRRPEYKGRYFIPFECYLLEVSHEEYRDYYREQNRQEYLQKEAVRSGELSLDGDLLPIGIEIQSPIEEIDEQISKEMMIAQLRKVFAKLDADDQQLVQLLYFRGYTERQCAVELGVFRNAIHVRKIKVLEKIGKLLG